MAQSTAKGGNSESVVRADRSRDFGGRDGKRRGFLQDAKLAAESMQIEQEPYTRSVMDAFVSTVLEKVEERYIQQHSGTHLVDQLKDSLRFLHSRDGNRPKFACFDPMGRRTGTS